MAAHLVESECLSTPGAREVETLVPQIQDQIVEVIMVVMLEQLIVHEMPDVQVAERVALALVPQIAAQWESSAEDRVS